MGVSENREHPIVPNGFADHYPYEKWLFYWEYTLFSDKPKPQNSLMLSAVLDPEHSLGTLSEFGDLVPVVSNQKISVIRKEKWTDHDESFESPMKFVNWHLLRAVFVP